MAKKLKRIILKKISEAYLKRVRNIRNSSSTVTEVCEEFHAVKDGRILKSVEFYIVLLSYCQIRRKKGAKGSLTVELGIFMDSSAYNPYIGFYEYNVTALTNHIATFLNAVRASVPRAEF